MKKIVNLITKGLLNYKPKNDILLSLLSVKDFLFSLETWCDINDDVYAYLENKLNKE